jgi:hypothetical protein
LEEIFVGMPAGLFGRFGGNRFGFGKGGSFGLEINGRVSVCGVEARVPQIVGDGAEINASLQQIDRGAVSQAVWVKALALERWLNLCCALELPFQDEACAEPCQWRATLVAKYQLGFMLIEAAVMEVLF